MQNLMKARSCADGKQIVEFYEGRAFEHDGVALHIRRSGTYWLLSFFNTGLLTRGIGHTIKEAVELYDITDGAIIKEWLYEIGAKRLRDYQGNYFEENTAQTVDLTYKDGKIINATGVKASSLI